MAREQLPSENLLHAEAGLELGADEPRAAEEADTFASTRVSSPARDAFRRFRRNWAAMISLAVIAIIVFMAIFAPFMHTTDPFAQDVNALNTGPSAHHWLGTDFVGRDGYSRIVYGLRVPLIVGFVGTTITVMIGTVFGLLAGFLGKPLDSILSRFTDLMFAF